MLEAGLFLFSHLSSCFPPPPQPPLPREELNLTMDALWLGLVFFTFLDSRACLFFGVWEGATWWTGGVQFCQLAFVPTPPQINYSFAFTNNRVMLIMPMHWKVPVGGIRMDIIERGKKEEERGMLRTEKGLLVSFSCFSVIVLHVIQTE